MRVVKLKTLTVGFDDYELTTVSSIIKEIETVDYASYIKSVNNGKVYNDVSTILISFKALVNTFDGYVLKGLITKSLGLYPDATIKFYVSDDFNKYIVLDSGRTHVCNTKTKSTMYNLHCTLLTTLIKVISDINILINNKYQINFINNLIKDTDIELNYSILPKIKINNKLFCNEEDNKDILVIDNGKQNNKILLSVLPKLIEQLPSYTFHLIGSSFDQFSLITKVVPKKSTNYELLGANLSTDDINSVMNTCNYGLSLDIESYGINQINMLNHGITVLTTNLNKNCYWYDYAVNLCNIEDDTTYQELISSIVKYLSK